MSTPVNSCQRLRKEASIVISMGKASNKHLQARISYLFSAASYLRTKDEGARKKPRAMTSGDDVADHTPETANSTAKRRDFPSGREGERAPDFEATLSRGCSRKGAGDQALVSQIRSISNKAQVRVNLDMKHQMCKRCNAVLVPNITSTESTENKSKGGKKPWATVIVVECKACGTSKRFPTEAKRQLRRTLRPKSVV